MRLTTEKTGLDTTVKGIETELGALQKRTHELEALLADQEQGHARRILELTSRHRQVRHRQYFIIFISNLSLKEADSEMERLRSAHAQAERTLESRERSHRQRIRGLEEQVIKK